MERLKTAVAVSLERRATRAVEGLWNTQMAGDGVEWDWVAKQVGTRNAIKCLQKW